MSVYARLRSHAAAVSDSELERAGGRLRALTPDQRAVVEELATRVAARVTDCLLEQARSDDRLKRALAGVYNSPGPVLPRLGGRRLSARH
jgi:glutamyl-tRNAGlu reductase-like protein